MEKLVIKGGKKLSGSIRVKGSKNAIGKMLVASLLTEEKIVLKNVPRNGETEIAMEICRSIGSEINVEGDVISIKTPEIKNHRVSELSRKNRLPILALGPLLARVGQGEVPMVGGDKIGPRPVDFHTSALEKLGAKIEVKESTIVAKADKLKGVTICLPYPSVGATENIMLASVLAEGKTTIKNAAKEPEILDMIKLLQKMGAIIELGAEREIYIEGVQSLHGAEHSLLSDRIESASFAIIALATDGNILVEGAVQEHLITFLNTVRKLGGEYLVEENGIRFFRKNGLKAIHIETDTHPGFATDWQQPLAVLLTQAKGNSVIHETVYEDRFGYAEDLRHMGADIDIVTKCFGDLPCRFQGESHYHSAIIHGPTPLKGANLEMRDIRAGMAHIIAA
ncbi:MAG: UDP-N-acetylglucosamine 1-carboxyvinyltransferase, partial [Candidatus Colwellbacteria bacterium]|nr:UDP-N-acetylglucosamine 1-carboxyvinyltransferase [Candidatus Colwellbacteria bacterium]